MADCPYCCGDGMDPGCDYILPCRCCNGTGAIDESEEGDDD
jgi:hypothetical protein